MYLYVANATKQILQFTYRIPERRAPITQPVQIGGQTRLSIDLSQPDIDAILEHWGRYGLIPVSELDRVKEFQGYLYAIGKPISGAVIKKAAVIREAVLLRQGHAQREEAAIEMVNTIERQPGVTPANQYEVSVVEEEPRGGYDPNQTHVAEGFRITRERPGMPEPPTPLRGRRRAA
jgi:hypothetical protein